MKIAVWKTGHEIADRIAEAVYEGLSKSDCNASPPLDALNQYHGAYINIADIHIGYGILRGMDKVFHACQRTGKPFFHIDKGYWNPGHYDGYYRISLNGTQQTFGLDRLEPDYERWDALGIDILPSIKCHGRQLLCPPTSHVAAFFPKTIIPIKLPNIERHKGCERTLQSDLEICGEVATFNSSVGWEALRQGIPVISDPTHSIVGAYQKLLDKPLHADSNERRKLFALMAGLQLRLDEIKSGQLWPLLHKLLSLQNH